MLVLSVERISEDCGCDRGAESLCPRRRPEVVSSVAARSKAVVRERGRGRPAGRLAGEVETPAVPHSGLRTYLIQDGDVDTRGSNYIMVTGHLIGDDR